MNGRLKNVADTFHGSTDYRCFRVRVAIVNHAMNQSTPNVVCERKSRANLSTGV